jgi:hypothetical protein
LLPPLRGGVQGSFRPLIPILELLYGTLWLFLKTIAIVGFLFGVIQV